MKSQSLLVLMLLFSTAFAHSMDKAREEGRAMGHSGKSKAISQIGNFPSNDLIPQEERSHSFDPKQAKEEAANCAKNQNYQPHSPTLDYLQNQDIQENKVVTKDEYFLKNSEAITQKVQEGNFEAEEAVEYSLETCQQTDAPYPISLIRDLHVEVTYDPGESKDVKVCKSHEVRETYSNKKDAEKAKRKWDKRLASDASIKSFNVGMYKEHKWRVKPCWVHHEDSVACNNYQTHYQVVREPKWEEAGEAWVYEDLSINSIRRSPDCTFIKSDCLDTTPSKIINGKEVKRQCWKEKLTFICQLPNSEECPFIRNQNCELIKKECLKEGPYGCSLWELTFKCYSKFIKRQLGDRELYGLDEQVEYEPNDSFSEVAAKLAVFDEIKKDLEASQTSDARSVQVFKGQKKQCSKSIADKVMYDCCFSYSGLAKDLGLKTCSADELALAEMREYGLCHYTGSYDGKFNNLWKSRDEHVFCCFGSKLARILQENARQQLCIGWDEPKHANCRGLSLNEISHLDFSKMDFSELYTDYEKKLPANFQSKLESLENRIKEKVRQYGEESKA